MENRFDEAATSWDEKPYRNEMAEKFAAEIQNEIKGSENLSAFEYGCGTGNVSFFLKEIFDKIILADSSQGMLDVVKEKIKNEKVSHFSVLHLDLEHEELSEKFDVIYTLMTLHHIKNVENVIIKFSSMLNDGGLLFIGDLEKEEGDFHKQEDNHDVHFGFDEHYMIDMLTANNFKINKHKAFHEMERTHTGTVKTYPLFFLSASLKEN